MNHAPIDAAVATPPDNLYQDGKPFHARDARDAQFTCRGSDATRDACAAIRPDARCELESPVGYWEGEIRCGGARVTEIEMEHENEWRARLAIPGCECSCDPAWLAADEAYRARRDECANVP